MTPLPTFTVGFVFDPSRRVLLLHRKRPPWTGLWNGLGGKVELGEDPVSAWRREVREESGLDPLGARLCGLVTYQRPARITPDLDPYGLLVVCYAPEFHGRLRASPEGELRFYDGGAVAQGSVPSLVPSVPWLVKRILSGGPPFSVHWPYTASGELAPEPFVQV